MSYDIKEHDNHVAKTLYIHMVFLKHLYLKSEGNMASKGGKTPFGHILFRFTLKNHRFDCCLVFGFITIVSARLRNDTNSSLYLPHRKFNVFFLLLKFAFFFIKFKALVFFWAMFVCINQFKPSPNGLCGYRNSRSCK